MVECTTSVAPCSIGRQRYGVAEVLSTIKGILALSAITEILSKSVIYPPGLAMDSQWFSYELAMD